MHEVEALDRHLDQQKGHLRDLLHQESRFLNEALTFPVDALEIVNHLLLDFISVGLMKIEMSYEVHLKGKEVEEFTLLVNDLLLRDGSVSNFL